LRPQRLEEYVGQRAAVESLRVSVEAARQRSEPLDHVLSPGRRGSARPRSPPSWPTRWGSIVTTAGPSLERGADLMGILTNLAERDVLFIDEIHRLPRVVEELLYRHGDFSINFVMDKGSTRGPCASRPALHDGGATTRPGMLSRRCGSASGSSTISTSTRKEDLVRDHPRSASILGMEVVPGGAEATARRRAARRASPTALPAGCATTRR